MLDLIWARAPEPIALVLDDVHLLGDDGESVDVLAASSPSCPRNGHLVLSCRTLPSIPLGRMESEGAALVAARSATSRSATTSSTSLADRLDVPDPVCVAPVALAGDWRC